LIWLNTGLGNVVEGERDRLPNIRAAQGFSMSLFQSGAGIVDSAVHAMCG